MTFLDLVHLFLFSLEPPCGNDESRLFRWRKIFTAWGHARKQEMKVPLKKWLKKLRQPFRSPILKRLDEIESVVLDLQRLARIPFAKKVVIGAAGTCYAGWVGTEREELDVTDRSDFLRYWKPKSISAFLAEHVWEHLSEQDARTANANCFEFLIPGGHFRIAVPDGYKPDPAYLEYVRPGGVGAGAKDHKILYNYQLLTQHLQLAGFHVQLLEYWDENGSFHFHEWSPADGYVDRSKRFDPRNQGDFLAYTSLIVDAIRPKSE